MVPFLILAVLCLAAWSAEILRHRRTARRVTAMRAAHEATIRILRLAASDLRPVALTLFGHAQSAQPEAAALSGLARRLLDMSQDLTEQTETPDAPRFITNEDIALGSVIEFAMAQVAAHLGPASRAWRVAPELAGVALLADRRALNQVLVNVLSGAASATRDGDWIEVACEAGSSVWSLVVQDEGIGLPTTANNRDAAESRGIGLRLTLARSLMQAHGGSLTVESKEGVGTRVRLTFPATRLLQAERHESMAR